jgi:hypothetical protein
MSSGYGQVRKKAKGLCRYRWFIVVAVSYAQKIQTPNNAVTMGISFFVPFMELWALVLC